MPNTKYMATALRRDIDRSFGRPKRLGKADQKNGTGGAPADPNAVFLDWARSLDEGQLRYALAALGGELASRIR